MYVLVVTIVTGLIAFMVGLLPLSPFQGISLPATLDTALGWLNWLVPMSDLVAVFGAWLVCLAAYTAVRVLLDTVLDMGEGVVSR